MITNPQTPQTFEAMMNTKIRSQYGNHAVYAEWTTWLRTFAIEADKQIAALNRKLTASEEALGLCVESMPIEAVELIEVLDEYVNFLGDYCDSVAGYLHAHNMGPGDFTVSAGNALRARLAERRLAYLRRKEG